MFRNLALFVMTLCLSALPLLAATTNLVGYMGGARLS
jgi:hypothetical protein